MGSQKVLRIAHIKDGSGPWVSDHPEVQKVVNSAKLPIPGEDKGFDEAALNRLNDVGASPVKFGFKDEAQMKRTFSDDHLAKLKEHGYEPQWTDVKDAWHGDTQSFFTTEEGDKKHAESQAKLKENTKYKQFSPEEIDAMNAKLNLKKAFEELNDLIKGKDDKKPKWPQVPSDPRLKSPKSHKDILSEKRKKAQAEYKDAKEKYEEHKKERNLPTPKATFPKPEKAEPKIKPAPVKHLSREEVKTQYPDPKISGSFGKLKKSFEELSDLIKNKKLEDKLKEIRSKAKTQVIRRRKGEVDKKVNKPSEEDIKRRKTQKDMESKMRADKTFRDAALQSNKKAAADERRKEVQTKWQNRGYDRAVRDESKGTPEPVAQKKRTQLKITEMNRRRNAPEDKAIKRLDAQKPVKKSLQEKWDELKKGMNNAGLGGTGSVKAGAVLPSISKLPKPGNNSLATSVGIPSIAAPSKKNPMKVAEQTQNKDIKDIKMKEAQAKLKADNPEMLKFNDLGQWSLQKDFASKENSDRDLKVKKLQAQVDAGTYKPDASKIAGAMLDPSKTKDNIEKDEGAPKITPYDARNDEVKYKELARRVKAKEDAARSK